MAELKITEFLEILHDFTDWLKKERNIEFRLCEENEYPRCVNFADIEKYFDSYFAYLNEKTDIFDLLYHKDK